MDRDRGLLKSAAEKSFTLIEIIIVIIIIAILSALGLPGFGVTKERTLDKEAKATLLLIRAAENIYKMEQGTYYPSGATATNVISDINANLKVSLPVNQVNWTYGLNNTVVASEKGTATRVSAGGRTWTILFPSGSSDIPTCAGTGCP
jgi:prepilin-type N-terminal cleavage/methylation domain-containing protein